MSEVIPALHEALVNAGIPPKTIDRVENPRTGRFPNSAPAYGLDYNRECLEAAGATVNFRTHEHFIGALLGGSEETAGILRDTVAQNYARGAPPLHDVLTAIERVTEWARLDGSGWTLKGAPVGRTKIGVVLTRELAKRIRVEAVQAEKTISDFVVGCVAAHFDAAPRQGKRGTP